MNIFKKTICVILVAVFAISFCACNGKDNNATFSQITNQTPSETESNTVKVTFPEGMSAVEIADRLEENGVCSAIDFIEEFKNIDTFKEELGFDFFDEIESRHTAYKLEGFLFPDTYEFYKGENPHSVIKRFLNNFNSKFTDEMKAVARENGFSVIDILTLASIVRDECSFESEMKNVSSVFANRIKSPAYQKLQSDVTINYVNDYITALDYVSDKDSFDYAEAYNTYKCTGLPEGPVCSPGIRAINAAIYPSETNYYFFVTDSENNYYYAETYEKHLENCRLCGY